MTVIRFPCKACMEDKRACRIYSLSPCGDDYEITLLCEACESTWVVRLERTECDPSRPFLPDWQVLGCELRVGSSFPADAELGRELAGP